MFKPNKKYKSILPDIALISVGYRILLEGDDPIIYSGNNKYGNRILGVIIGENEEENGLSYFHLILEYSRYYDFICKRVTLLELIIESQSVFVVQQKYSGEIIESCLVYLEDIPKEFLPLTNSYCPSFAVERTLDFGFSLKGRDADFHKATTDDASVVQDATSKALLSAFETINSLPYEPHAFLKGYKKGSFRIDISIDLTPTNPGQQSIIGDGASKEIIKDYLSTYVGFAFSNLSEEDGNSNKFVELKTKLQSIYTQENYSLVDVDKKLKSGLIKTVEILNPIQERLNIHFHEIEVINYDFEGLEQPIGLISTDFFKNVRDSIFLKEPTILLPRITKDNFPKQYKIKVYQFNTKSGIGKVTITDEFGQIDQGVSLHITSDKVNDFSNSKFTESEHKGTEILVFAYATRQENRIQRIDIDFDYLQSGHIEIVKLLT